MEVGIWKEIGQQLVLELAFSDQTEAAEFVLKIAQLSDELNHHAEIEFYKCRKVRLSICTHDAGNSITEQDHHWKAKVNKLLSQ